MADALDACLVLIDPADDAYTAQTALVSQDAAFFVVELLSDESAAVAALAAQAVAALAAHSVRACVPDMLRPAALRPQVELNPVQMDFVDSGAVPALVGLLLDGPPPAADAAADALAALTAFNAEGKEAYLEELVTALERGRLEALPHMDSLLGAWGATPREQVVAMLDRGLEPLLRLLASPAGPAAEPCLALLCSLLELRPGYGAELRGRGAARLAAGCLLRGGAEAQDAAARALWLLVRSDPRRLLCGGGGLDDGEGQGEAGGAALLGCTPLDLLPPLSAIHRLGQEQEARWAAEQEAAGSGPGGADGGRAPAGGHAPEVCSAAEAEQLLQELAAVFPEARAALPAEAAAPAKPSGCCIM